MARSKSSSSNIYGRIDHREPLDIADRSMAGEVLHKPDSAGIVPSTIGVEFKSLTRNTGKPDSSKGHDNAVVDSAVKSITNERQPHEKTPVDLGDQGVERFREQHGTSRDED